KVAPALATGCTVILKPASYTPLTSLLLGRIAVDSGVPAGVLNMLPGPGAALGEHIATHPLIDKIAFTGETRAGASLVKLSADGIKRVSLELGGKSPNIVFADADIAKAAAAAVRGGFGNAGQSCSARTRLLVERKIHDELVAAFVAGTERIPAGNPLAPKPEMAPLLGKAHWQNVKGLVDAGVAQGARTPCGHVRPGERPDACDD